MHATATLAGYARDVYKSTSWTLTCNAGFYLRAGTSNVGTCQGDKQCYYDSSGYNSCTHVCYYQDIYGGTTSW